MQNLTSGKSIVEIPGATVRQIINNLDVEFPGMKERLVDDGRVKPNISVAIDGEITTLGMLEKVGENSEVHFLPAIGGGRSVPPTPAVANAVHNATGIRMANLPMSPVAIMEETWKQKGS